MTLYEVLKVPPTATLEEIKTAYHEAARSHHPDRKPTTSDDKSDFLQIQTAWETLRDESKRKEYDLQLMKAKQRSIGAIALTMDDVEVCNDQHCYYYLYVCRCGTELEIDATYTGCEEQNRTLVECTGCSLAYDVSALESRPNE